MPDAQRQMLAAQVPLPWRPGHPSAFGALVCHIAETAMVTGQTIKLDGGLRLPLR
jgi:NAD(P)-dependent dehydrogenase (short-subunit alcohol dehydrogenase family)